MEVSWSGFSSSASVHVIRYTSSEFSWRRRVFWIIILCMSFGFFIFFAYTTLTQYFQYDVNSVVRITFENRSTFPAVTICNFNAIRKSKVSEANENIRAFVEVERQIAIDTALNKDETINYTGPNLSGQEVLRVYHDSGHTMDYFIDGGMLLTCSFHGRKCDKNNFTSVITRRGLCHTFNSGKDGHLKSLSQPGSRFGLRLLLSVQKHEYMLFGDNGISVGFQVYVHDQLQIPLMHLYGESVAPQTHTEISVTKEKVENLEPPYKTQCIRHIRGNVPYRRTNCMLHCEEDFIMKRCGCLPPTYLGVGMDFKYCDLKTMINCATPASNLFTKEDRSCKCSEPCEDTQYIRSLSSSQFPSDEFVKTVSTIISEANKTASPEQVNRYIRENLVQIDIYFKQMNYIIIKQTPAKTISDVYGDLGGILGVFLGASFLTALELIDFLIAYATNIFKLRNGFTAVKDEKETQSNNDHVHVASL